MIRLKKLIENKKLTILEDEKGEVMVGGYQTQHFDICPGATALYKDIESKGVDMDLATRTAKLQDALFFIEKHVEEEGYEPDPYYSEVAQILGDQIMTMAGMMDLGSEHEYIQGHIDRIQSTVGGDVNEGKNDSKIKELEAKLKSIKGNTPGDKGKRAAIKDDIKRLKNESLNEAAKIPSNIMRFVKDKGPDAVRLVRTAASWANKAGKSIVGGTAIGKHYDTIVLDMRHQGSDIYIDLYDGTIELNGVLVSSAGEFKKVLSSTNESLNEAANDTPHFKKVGSDYYVDTLFVQNSRQFGTLRHMWGGNFVVETPKGEVNFFRTSKTFPNFYGRSHEVSGNKEAVNMVVGGVIKQFGLKSESKLNEAPNYELYHDTYTSAINTALQYAGKSGYTTDKEEVADLVGLQSRRPGRGKYTKVSIPLYKNGKLQRKALQITVYNRDTNRNTFELTTYIR